MSKALYFIPDKSDLRAAFGTRKQTYISQRSDATV